jgi:hypothetical protein
MERKMNARVAIYAVALLLGACGGGGGGGSSSPPPTGSGPNQSPSQPTIASVTITAPLTLVAIESSMQLTATVRDSTGAVVTGQAITWSSLNTSAFTVTQSGLVTAAYYGSSTISASTAGVTGSIDLSANSIRSRVVTAPTFAIQPGASVQLSSFAKDELDRDIYFNITNWTSSDPAVATVSSTGRVDGLSAGLTWITAYEGPRSSRMRIAVQSPVPQGKIAFTSVRGPMVGSPPQAGGGIYLMDTDGSNQQLLIPSIVGACAPFTSTQCPKHWDKPSWNPDGMRLAVSARKVYWGAGALEDSLVFLCATGGQTDACTTIEPFPRPPGPMWSDDAHVKGTDPAWSPNGGRLAYLNGQWVAASYTFPSLEGAQPTWSPDGTRLAVVRNTSGNPDVWIVYADNSQAPVRLTDDPGEDSSPEWSPDGGSIAFVSNRDGNREVYVMAANGDAERNLTNDAADDVSPTWSPDSSRIAFETDRDGNREIYVTGLDGTGATNLTNNAAEDTQPAWRP